MLKKFYSGIVIGMSYSYIKSVFPNFETRQKFDPNKIYSNITLADSDNSNSSGLQSVDKMLPSAYDEQEMKGFARNLLKNDSTLSIPGNALLENYENATFPLPPSEKDNLRFYNIRVPSLTTPTPNIPITSTRKQRPFEPFDNEQVDNKCDIHCDAYVKHILECSKCKTMITKQLNIETDRIRNEEIMELLSYLIFGVFILLLLDNIKSR